MKKPYYAQIPPIVYAYALTLLVLVIGVSHGTVPLVYTTYFFGALGLLALWVIFDRMRKAKKESAGLVNQRARQIQGLAINLVTADPAELANPDTHECLRMALHHLTGVVRRADLHIERVKNDGH